MEIVSFIVPDAQDLLQLVQENMVADWAPSDVDLRPIDFEFITNNTIFLHLFNFSNICLMFLPSFDHVDSQNLAFQQSSFSFTSSIS